MSVSIRRAVVPVVGFLMLLGLVPSNAANVPAPSMQEYEACGTETDPTNEAGHKCRVFGAADGPDGALWWAISRSWRDEQFKIVIRSEFGRMTPDGVIDIIVPHETDANGDPVKDANGDLVKAEVGGVHDLVAGPDGDIWFTEPLFGFRRISRMTTSGGVIGRYPIPGTEQETVQTSMGDRPWDLTVGPDGKIWWTEPRVDTVGRIDPDKSPNDRDFMRRFELPDPDTLSFPWEITAGPDGNVWFTTNFTAGVGRVTPNGKITEFRIPNIPDSAGPMGIAAGPDGNLWFSEAGQNSIGRVSPEGIFTGHFEIKHTKDGNASPNGIVAGADGNLWFAQAFEGARIGRITTKGQGDNFPAPSQEPYFKFDMESFNGNVWYTTYGIGVPNKVGCVSITKPCPAS